MASDFVILKTGSRRQAIKESQSKTVKREVASTVCFLLESERAKLMCPSLKKMSMNSSEE